MNWKPIAAAAAAAVALVTFGVSAANAATSLFDFTFTTSNPLPGNGCCGPFNVNAKLWGSWNGSSYNITKITGTVYEGSGPTPGTYQITGLIPGSGDPLNDFSFNNLINTTAGHSPYSLDVYGLGFYAKNPSYYAETNANSALSLSAFNVWGNGGSSYTLGTTASYDVNTAFNGVATISASAVPEPATWAMMLFGFGGLGAAMRYNRRRQALAAA